MNTEECKQFAQVVAAYAEGKTIQYRNIYTAGEDRFGLWNDIDCLIESCGWKTIDTEYRIKPTPRLRAGIRDEVPVGAQIRHKGTDSRGLIVGCSSNFGKLYISAQAGTIERTTKEALDNFEWAAIGSMEFKPCGVMETE